MKLGRYYSDLAIILLNDEVAILGLNLLLYGAYWVMDRGTPRKNAVAMKYGDPLLARAYPDLDPKAINDLLVESWGRGQVFEPYLHFREPPFKGKYFNVHESGFRISKNQGPWPPASNAYNVFLFGGSTTFSYGLPDDQTLASFLQEALATRLRRQVYVYNFGAGSYQSTQERILFQELLVKGYRPNLAMFIDGLNDFAFPHVPNGTPVLERLTRAGEQAKAPHLYQAFANWPMARLAVSLRRRFVRTPQGAEKGGKDSGQAGENLDEAATRGLVDSVARRYLANKRQIEAVAREFGSQAIFVWQPVPFYKYDNTYNLFPRAGPRLGVNRPVKAGYERMERILETEAQGRDFLWCADIQEHLKEPLYVDAVHYTAAMSDRLAKYIAGLAAERGLLVEQK